ncbi:MAG: peptidase T [Bacilli bacterium]|nr:peptidase T [Bacilli bacterium]
MSALERFLKYVQIDTQSDETTHTTPSTEKQKNLGNLLVKELKELGLEDAEIDQYGNVYAHLKGEPGDKIGLNAHMDTALESSGANVKPRLISSWDGSDIKLNETKTLSIEQFPALKAHVGKDLVVTDGNTLLGADDKAGIAIIMGVLEYFQSHKDVKHHPISVCFTVDEEIGEGPDHFDINKMDADYAYTVDGAEINHVDYINFNAQAVNIKFEGVAVHPGEGKNALINALLLLNEFVSSLPQNETPYDANFDEGYWHINDISGTSVECECSMILREFDKTKLVARDNELYAIKDKIIAKYPKAKITINIVDQYENMEEYTKADPRPVNKAKEAIKNIGLEPESALIRGGTDGATFSKMGLVTPNLGTGSANHHGPYEYLVVQDFLKEIDIIVDILKA